MKIFIAYSMVESPSGGGNQFLKNLKKRWEKQGIYTDSLQEANVILFNSHQNLSKIIAYKKSYPDKIFVHRIDGPISRYRGRNIFLDKLIFLFAQELADGVVFQSKWSLEESLQMGHCEGIFQKVIHNAADPEIFYPSGNCKVNFHGKTKLIATCWSVGEKKGFDIYSYLDKNLNFDEYDFTFIGNSPVRFKNILHIKPSSSNEIATYLKESHIFICASERESCSNSIIEALSCGLPVVYKNSSSNPEVVKLAGVSFISCESTLEAIKKVRDNYNHYQDAINILPIKEVSDQYLSLFRLIQKRILHDHYCSQKISFRFLMSYNRLLFLVKLNDLFYLYTSGFLKNLKRKVSGL